jgi:hypothetical protein
LLDGVDVVGERPELRDHHEVEDADPDEEGDADIRHAGGDAGREQLDAHDEEQRHADDEAHPIEARGHRAVQRHVGHQQQRLSGGCVRPDLGAAAEQDERLPRGLDDGITDEEEEDVRQHQHRDGTFVRVHVGEHR